MMKFLIYLFMLNGVIMLMELKCLLMFMVNLVFLLSLMLMYSVNYSFSWMNIYSWMGMDNISLILILLSIWIIGAMFLSSIHFKNLKFYSFILLSLLLFLIMSFMSMNYFLFYLFFEISLIPTFMLIMGFGYQPERIGASMYMLFYTLFASLPLLILLFYLYNYFFSLSFFVLLNKIIYVNLNEFIFYLYMVFAFLVKLPLFMMHLWLPKAHIEAPVTGSMILAAVMLKLGGYGVMRSMMMMKNLCMKFNWLMFIISLFGMFYLSLMNLRCNDFKLIVAYSSVVHMGMMLMGLLSMTYIGFMGGLVMMIGHGFCSSALFLLINYSYERVKSRNLLMNKGMMNFLPSLSMWWFLFCVINMSAPISLNLLSELLILMELFNWSMKIFLLLMLGMYFSSIYSLYLFSYSQHGNFSNLLMKFNMNSVNDFLVLILHWVPLNFLILKVEIFL